MKFYNLLILISFFLVFSVLGMKEAKSEDNWTWKDTSAQINSRVSVFPSKKRVFGIAGSPSRVKVQVNGETHIIPGELVKLITEGSVAWRAGLRRGDVVVKWDGKYVGHDGELPTLINNSKGLGPFRVKIVRNGLFKVLNVLFNDSRVNTNRPQVIRNTQSLTKPLSENRAIKSIPERSEESSRPSKKSIPEPLGAVLPQANNIDIDNEIADILGE